MPNRIIENVHNSTHPRDAKTATFDTLAELAAVPFVARVAAMRGFHRFSYSTESDRPRLVAEFQGGYDWAPVGHLDGPVEGLSDHAPLRIYVKRE